MEDINKEINRALSLCVPFLLIVFFLDDLDKFFSSIHSRLGSPLLVLTVIILTILVLILFIDSAMMAWRSFRQFGWKTIVPLLICTFASVEFPMEPCKALIRTVGQQDRISGIHAGAIWPFYTEDAGKPSL